jgi:hypothetical protein
MVLYATGMHRRRATVRQGHLAYGSFFSISITVSYHMLVIPNVCKRYTNDFNSCFSNHGLFIPRNMCLQMTSSPTVITVKIIVITKVI